MPVDLTNPAKVVLSNATASTEIFYFGATLTTWVVNGVDRLFRTTKTVFDGSAPIRGGIPIAFPQFGLADWVKLPHHGFARISNWTYKGITAETANSTTIEFELTPASVAAALFAEWPHQFKLTYSVTLQSGPDRLTTSLRVENTDAVAFEFTPLLHTYFWVDDVSKVRVKGLAGTPYVDKTHNFQVVEETFEHVGFTEEVDRIYLNAPDEVVLETLDGAALVTVSKTPSMTEIVVWNVGEVKAKGIVDMGDEDWRNYVCVEAGSVDNLVTLEPKAVWDGSQTFTV